MNITYKEIIKKLRKIIPEKYWKYSECSDKSFIYRLIKPTDAVGKKKVEKKSISAFKSYMRKDGERTIRSFANEIIRHCDPTAFIDYLYEVDRDPETGDSIDGKIFVLFEPYFKITNTNAKEQLGELFYQVISDSCEVTKKFNQSVNEKEEFFDINTQELLEQIEQHKLLYVETSAFKKACKILEANKRILIVGQPGVGKSFTSEMLVDVYLQKNFTVLYSSQTENLRGVIESVLENKDRNDLVLIDDCLGQAYMTLCSDQESDLKKLIVSLKYLKNKYLILNSRIAILNSVTTSDHSLGKVLKELYDEKSVLNIEQLTDYEKAKIFYNHLIQMPGIKNEHYLNLQPKRRYWNIISHKNYNPRIIWHSTQGFFLNEFSPKKYYERLMHLLDHPKEIWDNEYNNRLSLRERLLLTTLYSLTNNSAKYDTCRIAYQNRISLESTIDCSKDNWNAALSILNGSMIIISKSSAGLEREIKMINPSINDYIGERIVSKGSSECIKLQQTLCAAEQIPRLFFSESSAVFEEKIKDKSILNLKYETVDLMAANITYLVSKYGITDSCYKSYVNRFLNNSCFGYDLTGHLSGIDILCFFIANKNIYDFYIGKNKFVDILLTFLQGENLDSLISIIHAVSYYNPDAFRFLSPEYKPAFEEIVDSIIEQEYINGGDGISDLVSDNPGDDAIELEDLLIQSIKEDMEYKIKQAQTKEKKTIPSIIEELLLNHIKSSSYGYYSEIGSELDRSEFVFDDEEEDDDGDKSKIDCLFLKLSIKDS